MDSQGLCLLVLPFPPALTFSHLSSAWVPALPPCLPPVGFFRGPLPSQGPLCLLMSATSHQTCFSGIWVLGPRLRCVYTRTSSSAPRPGPEFCSPLAFWGTLYGNIC